MRSLKVIVFRDTDKPYTIILSSTLIVSVLFLAVALISLLTFSVLGNIMLVAETGNGAHPAESVAGTTEQESEAAQTEPPVEDNAEEAAEQASAGEETTEGESAEEEPTEDLLDYDSYAAPMEDFASPVGEFITLVQSGPTVANGTVRYVIRVEKTQERLGVDGSGRFVAALVRDDGMLGPTFPTAIRSDGQEIVNPSSGELFRIRYRRDIRVEFAAADLEDYSAIALFIFEANDNSQLLWRKIETIRR